MQGHICKWTIILLHLKATLHDCIDLNNDIIDTIALDICHKKLETISTNIEGIPCDSQ